MDTCIDCRAVVSPNPSCPNFANFVERRYGKDAFTALASRQLKVFSIVLIDVVALMADK